MQFEVVPSAERRSLLEGRFLPEHANGECPTALGRPEAIYLIMTTSVPDLPECHPRDRLSPLGTRRPQAPKKKRIRALAADLTKDAPRYASGAAVVKGKKNSTHPGRH